MTETAQAPSAQVSSDLQAQHQKQPQEHSKESKGVVKNLSQRGVKKIVEVANAAQLKSESFYLQVLNIKEFEANNDQQVKKSVKLRFHLSDGESKVLAMMNKQVYDKLEDKIEAFDVLEVFTFMKQTVKERVILVLTKPPKLVYSKLKTTIGQPKDYSENLKDKVFDAECSIQKTQIPSKIIQEHTGEDEEAMMEAAAMMDDTDAEEKKDDMQEYYTPIKALSTFIYDWRIKARVTKKGPQKTWKNARSEGYFKNIELMDCHGTMIQATFFKDACDKFDPILKEGSIYLCSGGTVKFANQRFATVKNDFCLVFDKNAEIQEVPDDTSIDQKGYNFTTLGDLPANGQVRIIDFIGVLTSPGQSVDVQVRSGEVKAKRVITIADDSGLTIECCVWQTVAHSFDDIDEADPVIAIKGCRVVDFQGQQLTMDTDASYVLNPDLPRTKDLKKWYSEVDKSTLRPLNQGRQAEATNAKLESGRLVGEMNEMFQNDPEMMRQLHSQGNGASYHTVSGYITYVKNDEKAYYLACPEEQCRRKVQENDGTVDSKGKYRCDHCNRCFDDCLPTYMLLAKVSDFSDSVYVNFYRQQAETIMRGVSADRIRQLREQGELDQVSQSFYEAQWQHYTFTIQSKLRQFNDDVRLNFAAIRASPHSFTAENRQLIRRLELYRDIPDQVSN